MARPEAVIFDIGNVLIEWQPERFYDSLVGEARRKEVFGTLDLHAMNDKIDRGGHFHTVVKDAAEEHPACADEIMIWHDRWIEMAAPAIDGSVRLLRALRAKDVPVFALTNFGIGTFEVAEGHYDFLREFDRRYISGHMGVIKPEEEIYAMVEEDCGVAPGALLFADDRADNLAAASARGWQTHQFETWRGWARRLVDDGLLTAKEAGL
ncbi:MAG: HAD-IA family hydrolase [Pseudomonadota bacterium]